MAPTTSELWNLAMKPRGVVRPGDTWELCGTHFPERQVQVFVHKPGSDLSWLPDDDTYVVATDLSGMFCWSGPFPERMIDETTRMIAPIEPGEWEVIARDANTGLDIATATVTVLAPETNE